MAHPRRQENTGGPAGDLLYIEIDDTLPADPPFTIAAGNDVLGAGAIDDLSALAVDMLTDPITVAAIENPGDGNGTDDETIRLKGSGRWSDGRSITPSVSLKIAAPILPRYHFKIQPVMQRRGIYWN